MEILTELCSVPTAPFAEHQVIAFIHDWVKRRPRLRLSSDPAGNLLIELPAKKADAKLPRWVFTAHMDHPGFVAAAMTDQTTLKARFHGWVEIDYVRGAKVRFFDGGEEIPGVVTDATADEYDRIQVPNVITVKVKRPVSAGVPGMFDQGAGRVKRDKFYSRVCDDLAGAAACLAMLDELLAETPKYPPKSPVAVLLTRAEEEGFIGCVAACLRPKLLKKTDRVIAIECSARQPYAKQGDGVIIRVGDRSSIFNSSLTYFLTQQAEALQKSAVEAKDEPFKFQRSLMPGGTCEATVYDIFGFHAASLCVPLGNYHNMDKEKKKIGPEFIDVADWTNMVRLFVQLARTGHEYVPGHAPLKERVLKRFKKLEHLL